MANRYDFWTHGITAIIHDPRPAKPDGGPVQFLERAGHGTIVEQAAGTSNWFFLPIPTPTVLDDDTTIILQRVAFSFKVNDNAVIDQFQLWAGGTRIVAADTPLREFPRNVDFTHVIDNTDWNLSGVSRGPGVALGLRVTFRDGTPRGRVWIYGAGGHFST
jgi:hypothetical protein